MPKTINARAWKRTASSWWDLNWAPEYGVLDTPGKGFWTGVDAKEETTWFQMEAPLSDDAFVIHGVVVQQPQGMLLTCSSL